MQPQYISTFTSNGFFTCTISIQYNTSNVYV